MYDVTDEDSFERAKSWYTELRREIGKDAPVILAGNKCDVVNRTVSEEDALAWARTKGIEHQNTSALNGTGVEATFTALAESKCSPAG